jgi:GntR family negative regulator for fad regulon and positive regulator of fabA
MDWSPPPRPAELAETRLVDAILAGRFPPGAALPPERELAALLGVTRPTLREALQRLARDGWIEIHHGRSTRVRDYWREGNLGVLAAIARHDARPPDPEFVPNLLQVRLLLAPAYARMAVERAPAKVIYQLEPLLDLSSDPQAYARADWELHAGLSILSGNPIFTLILNGFRELYLELAPDYFVSALARQRSQAFYAGLLEAARRGDPAAAEEVTRQAMQTSIDLWRAAAQKGAA